MAGLSTWVDLVEDAEELGRVELTVRCPPVYCPLLPSSAKTASKVRWIVLIDSCMSSAATQTSTISTDSNPLETAPPTLDL